MSPEMAFNENYGNRPPGFRFAQQFTVEVLNVTGSLRGRGDPALRRGWRDPSGRGGNFAIGMQQNEDDRLGLSFDIEGRKFLNLSIDFSSIDVYRGGFVELGVAPKIRLTLHDNPSGARETSGTRKLDSVEIVGEVSAPAIFAWTEHVIALDSSGATNGNVILEIDLLKGGYIAFDNLIVTASNQAGDVGKGVRDEEGLIVADRVVAFESSELGPVDGPYGWEQDQIAVPVEPEASTLASLNEGLSLPTGTAVTLCFSHHIIFDGPGDDLFVRVHQDALGVASILGAAGPGSDFTYLGKISPGDRTDEVTQTLTIDLSTASELDSVGVVKLVGQDLEGGSPGFDLAYVVAATESARQRTDTDGQCAN